LNILRNFCRVLQISPKHFKISQYECCLVFRGTQLSYWMAFQIFSGRGRKTWSTASSSCSLTPSGIQSLAAILCKNHWEKHKSAFTQNTPLSVLYNFRIQISVGSIQFFGDFRVQTRAHWHSLGPERDVTRSARQCRAALGVRAATPPEAARHPRPHLPQVPAPRDALKSACHAPPRRSRRAAQAVHRGDRRFVHDSLPCAHAYRDRRSTTDGSCVIHSSQASERPYLNGRPFLARAHAVPPAIRAARGAAHPPSLCRLHPPLEELIWDLAALHRKSPSPAMPRLAPHCAGI
jgi:hypothetical protein